MNLIACMSFKKINFFSPFFLKKNLKDDFKLVRDEILNDIIYNYNLKNNNCTWWGVNTDENKTTTDLEGLKKINYEKIIPIYEKNLNDYNKKNLSIDYKVKIDEIWYIAYDKGKEATIHQHANGAHDKNFSCIHFFKFDPKLHNSVTFCNNRRVLNRYYTKKNAKYKNIDYLEEEYTPEVIQDDLIVFPSETYHRVKKNETDELRITICFNVKLV